MIAAGLAVAAFSAASALRDRAQALPCTVSYVYDGDTVAMDCGQGARRARVMGLDAPETKRASCAAEAALGARATARLRALAGAGPARITHHGRDKYRRDLIRLYINGRNVADTLISEGLAVSYHGGQRINWCARLAG